VTEMSSAHAPERPDYFGAHGISWPPVGAASLMWAAFLIALALAVIVLVIFGVGERGASIALRQRRDGLSSCSGSPMLGAQWRGCAARVLTDWRATGAN
jgi:hypothetical protein